MAQTRYYVTVIMNTDAAFDIETPLHFSSTSTVRDHDADVTDIIAKHIGDFETICAITKIDHGEEVVPGKKKITASAKHSIKVKQYFKMLKRYYA